jgi:hypothetical protein
MSAISPPLSITPNAAPASTIASIPAHAIAPATAAIGPTPADRVAPAILRITFSSESGTYGSNVERKKGSRAIQASSTCRAASIPDFAASICSGVSARIVAIVSRKTNGARIIREA